MSATGPRPDDSGDVMASVDGDGTYVIADLSDEEAWLSVGTEAAAPLEEWR